MSARETIWPAQGEGITFRLRDPIDHPEFRWPRTLLNHPVRWTRPCVRAQDLRLVDGAGEPVAFQLSRVEKAGPCLVSAVVSFFADLAPGAAHEFALRADPGLPAARVERPVRVSEVDGSIVLDGGALRVSLPASREVVGKDVPGPIMRLDRGDGWVGASVIRGAVERIETRQVEAGPLFADYEVEYRFADGADYRVGVRALQGCEWIELSEEMSEGVDAEWKLSWTGCTPTHRFSSTWPYSQHAADYLDPGSTEVYRWLGIDEPVVLGDAGEDPAFSGPGGRERPAEKFAFTVGPYAPAYAWGIRPHATFWDVRAGESVGVFIRDHAAWNDHAYASWASAHTLQLRFRHAEHVLHWTWPLRHGTRQTGVAFYDHERDLEVLRATDYQTTYTRELHHWQGTLSLDRVKDWKLTYDGKRPARLCTEGEFDSADAFLSALFSADEGPRLIAHGVNEVAGYLNIGQRPLYDRYLDGYDRFREQLSPEQLARVDGLLLLTAYVSAGEEIGPMKRMLAGHPNFLSDGKAALGCLAGLYPEHEAAAEWLDQFEKFVELAGVFHTRPAPPGGDAAPGRWTESLATYVWAFIRPAALGNALGMLADGRNRLSTPQLAQVGDWLVNALTAPVLTGEPARDGRAPRMRMHPPQGAHAYWPRRPPIEMRLLGEALRNYRPLTAEHLLWGCDEHGHRLDIRAGEPYPWQGNVRSAGNRGTNPRLRSIKHAGYGVTLRAEVDQPAEVAVFLQQTDRGPNYRWGIADENGSGHIYYYAGGHAYSGHGPEDAGDRRVPDATFVSSCGVWKEGRFRSIGPNALDRPYYDLEYAQFAEITSAPDSPVADLYPSRSVMLVGGDYIVTYDRIAPNQRAVWTWVTATEPNGHDANSLDYSPDRMPFIHVVRGVRTDGELDGEFSTAGTRGVRLDGRAEGVDGSTLAVVSHRDDLRIEPQRTTPWGAKVRTPHSTDYVFRFEQAVHYEPSAADFAEDEYGLWFRGTAGTIRVFDDGERQLVLFHGTGIGTRDLSMTTEDPDIGLSLRYRGHGPECEGVYVAPAGSSLIPASLTLRMPGADMRGLAFAIDGEPVRPAEQLEDGMTIELPSGRHRWELAGVKPRPIPAEVVRTEAISGGAVVHFREVPSAEYYEMQLSDDTGETWRVVSRADQSPHTLAGLEDGRKYHVRVVAGNADRQASPGIDYPIYVSDEPPAAPDGLKVELGDGVVRVTWGEVLGASGYRLYRRAKGVPEFRQVFAGLGFAHEEVAPGSGALCEYAVAAENGNGLGPMSTPVDTDPASWRHFRPPGGLAYRRQHTYNQPPYLP